MVETVLKAVFESFQFLSFFFFLFTKNKTLKNLSIKLYY